MQSNNFYSSKWQKTRKDVPLIHGNNNPVDLALDIERKQTWNSRYESINREFQDRFACFDIFWNCWLDEIFNLEHVTSKLLLPHTRQNEADKSEATSYNL